MTTETMTQGSAAAGGSSESGGIRTISPGEAKAMLDRGEAVLVDVRERDEHRREHVKGASVVPLSSFDADAARGSDDHPPLLLCRTGRRSHEAGERLLEAGCRRVLHVEGGLEAWKKAGLPVVENRSAPLPLMQQTQIAIGILVLVTVLLGAFWTPWALILTGFMGAGLIFAGVTGFCGMANLIAKMPWNRSSGGGGRSCATG